MCCTVLASSVNKQRQTHRDVLLTVTVEILPLANDNYSYLLVLYYCCTVPVIDLQNWGCYPSCNNRGDQSRSTC